MEERDGRLIIAGGGGGGTDSLIGGESPTV